MNPDIMMRTVKNIFRQKKGIMGIGMLMIFISTILVSAIAAGVLIRSTGILQERAIMVEQSARERLVNGITIYNVYASGNTSTEELYEFEFTARTRSGSPPVQMKTLGMSFVTSNLTFSAMLNETKIGKDGECSFENLTAEDEYCFENRLGNNDTVLEDGEFIAIKFKLDPANALGVDQAFEVGFQPKTGALEILELRTPELVLSEKLRIR